MDVQSLLTVLFSMSGFGALVSALVNLLKSVGVVKDSQAQTWVCGLNLLGVLGLYALGISGAAFDLAQADSTLNLLAQFLVAAGQLLLALGGSKLFYGAVRGAAWVGKSFSQ